MDHRNIQDRDVIGRYRRNQLAPAEAAEFETHLIGCVECQDLLEADAGIARGIAALPPSWAVREPRSSWSWRQPLPMALAASIALGVIGTGVTLNAFLSAVARVTELETALAALGGPQGELPTYHLALMRGTTARAVRLRMPREAAWYVLELEVPDASEGCCRVVIEDDRGAVRWEGDASWVADLGTVRVLLARDYLGDGEYRVQVFGSGVGGQALADHRIEVQHRDEPG